MENAGCAGCGKALASMKRQGNPRRWCSEACRVHSYHQGKKVPCAAGCGRLCWPDDDGQPMRICRPCRSVKCLSTRVCPVCSAAFAGKAKTCSYRCGQLQRQDIGPCDDCGKQTLRQRNRSGRFCAGCLPQRIRARHRLKNHKRRVRGATAGDVTPEYERTLRRKAKRCPMPGCGIRLIDEPGRSNSKELDHIIPVNIGGTHTIGNVRIICRTCNNKRPSDGSDFTGQPTLWSQDLAFAMTLRSIPKPKASKPVCSCGHSVRKGELYCATCKGKQAASLRSSGMKWQDIADHMGYASPGAAHNAARYGEIGRIL